MSTKIAFSNTTLEIAESLGHNVDHFSHGLQALGMTPADIDKSLRPRESFENELEPETMSTLRYESYLRLVASNLEALKDYLDTEDPPPDPGSEQHPDSIKAKLAHVADYKSEPDEDALRHAKDMMDKSKTRIRQKALKRFRMERELHKQRQLLLENQKRHEQMLHAREKEQKDKLREYRERDRLFKLEAKIKRDAKFKEEQILARREHEKQSDERRKEAQLKTAKAAANALKIQNARRQFEAKRTADKEKRSEEEEKLAKQRLKEITEQNFSATIRHEENMQAERLKAARASEKKKKDRLRMEVLRREREVSRIKQLKDREIKYRNKLIQHQEHQKKKDTKRALMFAERDKKILEKQRKKEERAKAHEQKMILAVHEGSKKFEELKAQKARDAAHVALYQRLKSEEAQAKVQRQRNLENKKKLIMKLRIDKKEIRLRAKARKEKQLFHARDAMKREALIFNSEVQRLVEESIRTSNWCENKEKHLFHGVGQKDMKHGLEDSAKLVTKGKPSQKSPPKKGSPPPPIGSDPNLQKEHRDRRHAPRWVRGHSNHDHIIAHLENHDEHGHMTAIAATETRGPSSVSPVRPADRLGSSIRSRLRLGVVSPKKKQVGSGAWKTNSKATAKAKKKTERTRNLNGQKSSPKRPGVKKHLVLPTSNDIAMW